MTLELSPHESSLLAIHAFGAMQKVEEITPLVAAVASTSPKTLLEIGFGRGGTSWLWSKISSLETLISLDLPDGPWGGSNDPKAREYIHTHSKARTVFISGSSANSLALEKVRETLGEDKLDFLFIDGDHSYAGVKTDYLTYSPLVRPGGFIAFHDICEHDATSGCEVKKFWDELKETYPKDKLLEFIAPPLNWGGIGLLTK